MGSADFLENRMLLLCWPVYAATAITATDDVKRWGHATTVPCDGVGSSMVLSHNTRMQGDSLVIALFVLLTVYTQT